MALNRLTHFRSGAFLIALGFVLALALLAPALADEGASGPLSAGWHMVGVPTDTTLPLAECLARDTATGETLSLPDAGAAAWIGLPLYYYEDGGYRSCGVDPWDDSSTVPPWAGLWCLVNRAGVELVFSGTRLSAGYGVAVALDRPLYYVNAMPPMPPGGPPAPTANMTLTVFNWTSLPVDLFYCDCQRYDFEIYDWTGKLMWRWSDGKGFCDATGHEQLLRGQKVYMASTPLKTATGAPYPAGLYKLVAYLTTGCAPTTCPPGTTTCVLPFHKARGEITFEVKWIY